MAKYKYMELVKVDLQNRGTYLDSKTVLNYSFENRYIETWRGMFMFDNANPKPSDKMIGNFYLECDNNDFDININIITTAIDYMKNKYNLDEDYVNLFTTNRSIWIEVPYKVFGIYPQKNLNKIYKSMATEVNEYIKETLKISKALDLTIYKWNGLIHALGSYLPKIKNWVRKFDYCYLINELYLNDKDMYNSTRDYLVDTKYDTCFDYNEIDIIPACQEWAKLTYHKEKNNSKKKIKKAPSLIKLSQNSFNYELIVEKIRNIDLFEGIRNNAVFAYTLALKNISNNNQEIKSEVLNWVKEKNKFYYLSDKRQIERTINSALSHNYNLSEWRLIELGITINKKDMIKKYDNTFIIPRQFIKLLNENKCHWKCYKLLLDILYTKQILNKDYIYNLEGEKYKKNVQAYFEKLQEIGLISYAKNSNEISIKLIEKSKEVYKSYVVIPKCFVEGKYYKNINKSIKVFCEILRSNYINSEEIHMTNITINTIAKNLYMTVNKIKKVVESLRKEKLISFKYIVFGDKKLLRFVNKKIVYKIQAKKIKEDVAPIEGNNKMIYSIKTIKGDSVVISMDIGKYIKNIYGDLDIIYYKN